MGSVLRVSEAGRLDLPIDIRKAVGLEQGGAVSVWVEDGEIRVGAVWDLMASLQSDAVAIFSGTGDSVEAFVEDRRDEAAREDART